MFSRNNLTTDDTFIIKNISEGNLILKQVDLLDNGNENLLGKAVQEYGSIPISCIKILKENSLLTQTTFEIMTDGIISKITPFLLKLLIEYDLLDFHNFYAIFKINQEKFLKKGRINHKNKKLYKYLENEVDDCLKNNKSGDFIIDLARDLRIYNYDHNDISKEFITIWSLTLSIVLLKIINLDNQKNIQRLIHNITISSDLAISMYLLALKNILTDKLYAPNLMESPYYGDFCSSIRVLYEGEILTDYNFELLIKNSKSSYEIATLMSTLNEIDLLNPDNQAKIIKYAELGFYIKEAFFYLAPEGLLNQNSIDFLLQDCFVPHVIGISRAIILLHKAGKFTNKIKLQLKNNPKHALLIAQKNTCLFDYGKEGHPIDREFCRLARMSIILGRLSTNKQSLVYSCPIPLLANIAHMTSGPNFDNGACEVWGLNLDESTANVISLAYLKKSNELTYGSVLRMTSICALFAGLGAGCVIAVSVKSGFNNHTAFYIGLIIMGLFLGGVVGFFIDKSIWNRHYKGEELLNLPADPPLQTMELSLS